MLTVPQLIWRPIVCDCCVQHGLVGGQLNHLPIRVCNISGEFFPNLVMILYILSMTPLLTRFKRNKNIAIQVNFMVQTVKFSKISGRLIQNKWNITQFRDHTMSEPSTIFVILKCLRYRTVITCNPSISINWSDFISYFFFLQYCSL